MTVDRERLESFLAERLRLSFLRLHPLDVQCACPVFRGESVGLRPMFVKVAEREAAARALRFLSSAADCDLLPRPIVPEVVEFDDRGVVCLEWKPAARVDAEKMSDKQLESFLDGCRRLSAALAAYGGPVPPSAAEDDPEAQYAALARYSRRHPLVGRLLKPLLAIPEVERTYGTRKLVAIHGDLQPKNYGFEGERFCAVYDTDDLTRGLACEDAAYAFTERARRLELSADDRRRLQELFRKLVTHSPWPRDEWLVAVNHARLRIAARRLANHPDSLFIPFDIARRDRPLGALADFLKECSC